MGSRYFALVTGASRGFGKSVAEELVRRIVPQHSLDIILVARGERGLQSTATAIEGIAEGLGRAGNVVVRPESMDLADIERLEHRLDGIFACIDPTMYSKAVLVNNAGAFAHIGPTNDIPSSLTLKQEVDLNVTACLWVTSRFSGLFGAKGSMKPPMTVTTNDAEPYQATQKAAIAAVSGLSSAGRNVVVNVSSSAAIKPIKFWGVYSAGKAARDMFHRVLALEQAEIEGLKVLNYAPGPMDTDMSAQVRESGFNSSFEYVNVDASASKCVRLALGGGFETGSHIDFFDSEKYAADV